MLALIVIQTAVVVLLAILVAGLLRSHADILRALHDLGVGLGDPSTSAGDGEPPRLQLDPPQRLPGAPAADLAGTTPSGDAVHGFAVELPTGWEGAIFRRPAGPTERTHPIVHLATLPLSPTPTGDGYWILDDLQKVFAFGAAPAFEPA